MGNVACLSNGVSVQSKANLTNFKRDRTFLRESISILCLFLLCLVPFFFSGDHPVWFKQCFMINQFQTLVNMTPRISQIRETNLPSISWQGSQMSIPLDRFKDTSFSRSKSCGKSKHVHRFRMRSAVVCASFRITWTRVQGHLQNTGRNGPLNEWMNKWMNECLSMW